MEVKQQYAVTDITYSEQRVWWQEFESSFYKLSPSLEDTVKAICKYKADQLRHEVICIFTQ
jgi:hypothetical protein